MFWKFVKIIRVGKLLPKHPRQWSITFRLASIYALSALTILIVTTLTLYWIFTARLEQENHKFLVNNILVLQKVLQDRENISDKFLREEIVIEPAIYHYYVRIVDDAGKVLHETPGMSDKVPSAAFNKIFPTNPEAFLTRYWDLKRKKHRSKHYLLMSGLVVSQGKTNREQFIQIAKDISAERNIVNDYRRGLLIVLLMGVICSAGVGIVVTRKGLEPLRNITQSTQLITIARLQERLDPSSWPSELSELAIAFNSMLDRIEDGFTRLSQFSGDLAHELRTPITNLMGEAEIVLSRVRTDAEYREVLESSLEEFSRLSYMIENLLFLARAENPQAAIIYSTFDMKKVMKDICDFYEAVAEEKNVKIYYQGNVDIKADLIMLRRALSNLVSNALKHTAEGGLITLIAGWDDKNGRKYISVSDNGEGIADEHIPHLFDRFYRVDSARSHRTGGTGLGLAMVKFIMDLHRGHVSIASQLGKGTTITLLFPH